MIIYSNKQERLMIQILQYIQIISAALLIILILLHSPKGDGLAAIGGASQAFSSQKGVEAGLNKLTTIISIIFISISLILGYNLI